MKRCLLFLIFFAIFGYGWGQGAEYVKEIVCRLSADDMKGRGYSQGGDSLAADFIASELKRHGAKPYGDSYLQRYPLDIFTIDGVCRLKVDGKELRPYDQFKLKPMRTLTKEWLEKARWRTEKDGIWYIGVEKLGMSVPLTPFDDMKAPYVVEVLDSVGTKPPKKIKADITVTPRMGYLSQNVCGYIPGETDTLVVFTAHYDHLGMMGDKVCFHGAHDNASGVATVLDIARRYGLSKPHYTLVFCFFSGEEAGLLGSSYMAQHPLFDLKKVRLLVNLDLLCGGSEGFMVVNGKAENTTPFVNRMKARNEERHLLPEIKLRDNAANSDHWWFSKECPAIFIYTLGGRYGDYHSPYDTCDKCGIEDTYEKVLQVILAAIE